MFTAGQRLYRHYRALKSGRPRPKTPCSLEDKPPVIKRSTTPPPREGPGARSGDVARGQHHNASCTGTSLRRCAVQFKMRPNTSAVEWSPKSLRTRAERVALISRHATNTHDMTLKVKPNDALQPPKSKTSDHFCKIFSPQVPTSGQLTARKGAVVFSATPAERSLLVIFDLGKCPEGFKTFVAES